MESKEPIAIDHKPSLEVGLDISPLELAKDVNRELIKEFKTRIKLIIGPLLKYREEFEQVELMTNLAVYSCNLDDHISAHGKSHQELVRNEPYYERRTVEILDDAIDLSGNWWKSVINNYFLLVSTIPIAELKAIFVDEWKLCDETRRKKIRELGEMNKTELKENKEAWPYYFACRLFDIEIEKKGVKQIDKAVNDLVRQVFHQAKAFELGQHDDWSVDEDKFLSPLLHTFKNVAKPIEFYPTIYEDYSLIIPHSFWRFSRIYYNLENPEIAALYELGKAIRETSVSVLIDPKSKKYDLGVKFPNYLLENKQRALILNAIMWSKILHLYLYPRLEYRVEFRKIPKTNIYFPRLKRTKTTEKELKELENKERYLEGVENLRKNLTLYYHQSKLKERCNKVAKAIDGFLK